MTLLRLSLRSHRTGAAAIWLIGALAGIGNSVGFAAIAGTSPQERAAFAQQMTLLGKQLAYILPPPDQLDTVGGYLQWRNFGTMSLVFAVWALVAASGVRGDEERGVVEQWLAAGASRTGYVLARLTGFAIVAALVVAAVVVATYAGAVVAGDATLAAPLALEGVALLACTMCLFALSLLVAQLAGTRRSAAGFGGMAVAALFLMNSMARTDAGPRWLADLSPFGAYDRSTPLLRGGGLDVTATISLLAAAVLLAGVAALAFVRRDIGGTIVAFGARAAAPRTTPARDPLLRLPVLAALTQQRIWILGWMIGLAVVGASLVSLTKAIVDSLIAIPTLRVYFERVGGSYESFAGAMWVSTAMLLLSGFALAQVSAWASEDADGRLEAVLAQPVARVRVAIERVASLVVAAALPTAAGAAAVFAVAASQGFAVSLGRQAGAAAILLALPFAMGAIGAAVAGWRPRLAVWLLGVVAVWSYFIQQFAAVFAWPEWLGRLSLFTLLGNPFAADVDWAGVVALVGIGVVGSAIGAVSLARRDVGR